MSTAPYILTGIDQGDGVLLSDGSSVLDTRHELAASLEAQGNLTPTQIARAAGLSYGQFQALRTSNVYRQTVRNILSSAKDAAYTRAIATRAGRLSLLQARHDLLSTIQEQRGVACDPRYMNPSDEAVTAQGFDPEDARRLFPDLGSLYDPTNPACNMVDLSHALAPGASTGLIAHHQRAIGTGLSQRIITEYEIDTSLIASMTATEKQAAQEAGQWTEKHESTVQKLYINVDMEQL